MTRLPTDARLARRAAAGDERAFAAIYKRYHQDLYRFCLSILSRPEDAQDALQNTMVKALRALPGEERQIELKPWLYRVAHNESIEVLRRRREGVEFDPERAMAASEPSEAVAQRERLRRLLADLEQLPERQRTSLVMRELGGLGFEQIAESFETSPAVARQTVYEARLNLRQLEAGREMGCEQVTRQLSDADGRVTRRREIQAHLRSCRECREFRDAIASRRHDLAALAPLPAAAAGSILHGLLGAHASASGVAGGAVGAGAGKVVATSAVVKSVAAVAVVATVGVTAADRGGLIDAGLPGGKADTAGSSGASSSDETLSGRDRPPTRFTESLKRASEGGNGIAGRVAVQRRARHLGTQAQGVPRGQAGDAPGTQPTSSAPNGAQGPPASLPPASQHGQETAAAHRASHHSSSGSSGHGQHRGSGAEGKAHGHAGKGGASGAHHTAPQKHPPPASAKHGGGAESKPPAAERGGSPAHEDEQPQSGADAETEAQPGTTNGQKTEAAP
jgi:RNA polymerase sigma factor (sigma-70 family)